MRGVIRGRLTPWREYVTVHNDKVKEGRTYCAVAIVVGTGSEYRDRMTCGVV
jgi:hypothetical protein